MQNVATMSWLTKYGRLKTGARYKKTG